MRDGRTVMKEKMATKPLKTIKSVMKKTLIWVCGAIAIVVLLVFAVRTLRVRHLGNEAIKQSASSLLQRAGGSDKVCAEARQLFSKFGVSKMTFFYGDELKNCPALTTLGTVDGIWPGDPPYIKIRVGTHLNGYIIKIIDTNSDSKSVMSTNSVELVPSCIYAYE